MTTRGIIRVVLGSVAGAVALNLLAIPQKMLLGADPFHLKGIIVPTLFGGIAGSIISYLLVKGREYSSELLGANEQLAKEVVVRRRTHDALKKSEEFLRDFLDNANDLIQIVGPDGRLVFANDAWRRTLGYSQSEIDRGLSVFDVVHPDVRSHCKEVFQRVRSGESLSNIEAIFVTKEGKSIVVEGNVNCRYRRGKPTHTRAIFRDVTERRKGEEALRESEQTLSSILAASPIAIARGQDRKVKWINEAWVKMFGLEDESEHVGRSTRVLYPSTEEHERVGEVLYGDLAAGRVNAADVRFIRKDGSIFDGHMRLTFFDPSDPEKGVIVACSDISERKKAEEKIRQQNEFLNTVLESLTHPFYVINVSDSTITMANSAAGIPDSSRKTCYALTHGRSEPCNTSEHPCPLEEVTRTGKPATMMHVHYDNQGDARNIEVHAYPIFDGEGNVKQVIEYGLDVTERKRAEEERLRLATAIEQSAESIVITDKDGTIQYVNPAFANTSGYSREEAVGRNPRILKSGKQDRGFYEEMWTTLTNGRVWTGRLINKKNDGTLYEEDATISPIKDESGEILSYVAAKRDVTHQVLLENQLRQAQKMEAIGTLAGGIAHDFNNLLQIILGYADMLLLDQDKTQRAHERLLTVRKAVMDGRDLVKGLLTFGRKVETNPRPVDLNHEVRRVQKLLYRAIPKMIKIELVMAEDLKTVNADSGQIEQVLLNLAVNSQHAMPEGGRLTIETGNVTLDEEYCRTHLDVEPGEYVLLTISDTGHGMEKGVVDHIFEPFFTTKKPGEGTGLGLSMVFGIVKSHRGYIACYSEPRTGTTFKIYLPAMDTETEPDHETTLETLPGGTETILLVDDEKRMLDLGAEMLSSFGYHVVTAENGYEALDLYGNKKDEIRLVILDMIMPRMGGKECLEKLLKTDPEIKVLIASGYSANGPTKEAVEAGARGFIQKPFDAKQILHTVRTVLDEG